METFKRFKPFIFLLIAGLFFSVCMLDWFHLRDMVLWCGSIILAIIFSVFAVIYGIRFIKNKERTGWLFIIDLIAIIAGTIIFILTAGLSILLSLFRGEIPQD
jgi:hypothetical protein